MNLVDRRDIGQLFLLGFRGDQIPSWLKEFELKYGLGGVILFDYNCQTKLYENNIISPDQVRGLCSSLSALTSRPLIFVDQEGGKVRRLKEKLGFAPLPSQFQMNQLPKPERRLVLERSLSELRSLGFHFNLAPVIDLNLNPNNPDIGAIERSYSDRAEDVEANFQIINEVAKKVHIGLSLKHYPGLGGATVNSHLELTDLSDTILESQLELFYELANTMPIPSLLLSHGMVRQWDSEYPTSISAHAIQNIRNRVPNALLISDDLQMQALQKKFPSKQASLIGIQAGIDLVLIGNNLMNEDEHTLDYAESIYQEALKNPALAEKIQSANQRVRSTKAQLIEPSSQSHHFFSANSSE